MEFIKKLESFSTEFLVVLKDCIEMILKERGEL